MAVLASVFLIVLPIKVYNFMTIVVFIPIPPFLNNNKNLEWPPVTGWPKNLSMLIKITLIFNENMLFTFSPVYATVSEDFKHKRADAWTLI